MSTIETAKAGPASRMTLASVVPSKPLGGLRIMLYTPEGLGKTTWAAAAPRPIFIAPERGFPRGVSVPVFPTPRSWAEVGEAVGVLMKEPHDYQTLVIDTIDWLITLLYDAVVANEKSSGRANRSGDVSDVEDMDFGKGYERAAQWLLRFLRVQVDALIYRRKMNVIFLAHSQVKTFKNPEGPDYDRYSPKLNERVGAVLQEWVDVLLFGNYRPSRVVARSRNLDRAALEKGKLALGMNEQDSIRVVYTQRRASFNAKNRHNLPFEMPLDFASFAAAVNLGNPEILARIERMRAAVLEQTANIEDVELRARIDAYVNELDSTTESSIGKLAGTMNRVRTILMEQAERAAIDISDLNQEPPINRDDSDPQAPMGEDIDPVVFRVGEPDGQPWYDEDTGESTDVVENKPGAVEPPAPKPTPQKAAPSSLSVAAEPALAPAPPLASMPTPAPGGRRKTTPPRQ